FLEGSVGYIEATPTGGVTQGEAFNLQSIKVFAPDDAEGERIINIIGNGNIDRDIKHITPADMIAAINYFFNLLHEVGTTDDIDHLGNRR
ncbi:hypothetical protein L0P02_12115, partial [Bifidobacterium longum]|nr:hypothetical protein [Bifidobacterium longum]